MVTSSESSSDSGGPSSPNESSASPSPEHRPDAEINAHFENLPAVDKHSLKETSPELKKRKDNGLGESSQPRTWDKFLKPDPFPANISQARKREAWLDWRKHFKMALEIAGEVSQRKKAAYLFMSIGDEVRKIIMAHDMMPEANEAQEDFPHFDHLLQQLDNFFRGTSDVSIDLNTFATMKQEPGEGAREFSIRLRRQASICQLKDSEDMIRSNFVRGMASSDLAKQAFVNNWDLETIISSAVRADTMSSKSPWGYPSKETVEIAALADRDKGKQSENWRRTHKTFTRDNRYQPYKPGQSNFRGGSSQIKKLDKPCTRCGNNTHKFNSCPAEGRACARCHKTGHFAAVCSSSVREVRTSEEIYTDENEKVKIYN